MNPGNQPRGEPKLILPFLAPFYDFARDFSWLLMRTTLGGLMLYHAQINGRFVDPVGMILKYADRYGGNGWSVPYLLSSVQYFSETICAVLLIFGLLTRVAAAAIAIELAVITFGVYWPHGFHFGRTPGGGAEFPFLWGMMVFIVALRGGGPYSLDRRIGREL